MTRRAIILVVIALVCINLFVIGHIIGEHRNRDVIQQYHALLDEQHQHKSSHNVWLNQLNNDYQRYQLLTQSHAQHYWWFGATTVSDLIDTVSSHYQHAIERNLIPLLQHQLHNNLNTNDYKHHPIRFYNNLKAYILATSSQRNTNWISHWLSKQNNIVYQQHIYYAGKHNLIHWQADRAFINNQQQRWQKMPLSVIAFCILNANASHKQVNIFPGLPKIADINISKLTVSTLYNSHNFSLIYNKSIPRAAAQYIHGDSVTGKIQHSPLTTIQRKNIIINMQQLYLQNYRKAWSHLTQRIDLKLPHSLNALSQTIHALQSRNNPIWSILTIISENASMNASAITPLQQFLQHNQGYQGFQAALGLMQQQIQAIHTAKDPNQAAFALAVHHSVNQNNDDTINLALAAAPKLPQPIQNWLYQLTMHLWQQQLALASNYIQQQWLSQVFSFYQNHIERRFPIDTHSNNDISINNFQAFFGPSGLINRFFNQYIAAFINTRQHYWTFKKINGMRIPLTQHFLDMLMRASLIQKMFYLDNPNTPTLRFSLSLKSLNANTQSIALNIGGHMFNANKQSQFSNAYSWPGSDGEFITLRFHDINGSSPTMTLTGYWSWLRLIKNNTITSTDDPQTFTVSLSLGSNQASMKLVADHLINPYLPNLLTALQFDRTITLTH